MSDINFGEAFVTVTPDFDGTAGRGAFAARLQDGLNTAFATIKTSILDSIGENIGQVVVDATKRFVGEFNTMETALREVLTLGAGQGAFQSQFDELQEQVTQFNLEAGKLSEETIPAVYNAISAGVPQDNVFEFLETANIAATAGVAELDASVAVLSAVSNAYADVGLTAAEASDILFQTVKGGVTNFSLLADNLGKVTPIAAAVGVQLEEVAGGLALLTKVGIDTATATTQIRAALVELSNPASQVATIFTELSGGTFQAFTEGGGTLVDALKLLTVQADQTGIAVQDMFSSVEAKTAITAFASDIDGLQNAIGEAANSAGATGEAYEIMSGSVEFAIKRLDALRESVGEVIGANLQDNVRDLTNLLVDLGPTLIAIADTLSSGLGQTTRLIVIPALKALTPPLKLLGSILEQIPEEVVALTAAWLALNSAFRFNPINALTSNLGLLTARLGSTTVASRALGTSLGQNLAKQAAAGTGAMGTLNKVTTSVGKSLPSSASPPSACRWRSPAGASAKPNSPPRPRNSSSASTTRPAHPRPQRPSSPSWLRNCVSCAARPRLPTSGSRGSRTRQRCRASPCAMPCSTSPRAPSKSSSRSASS